MNIQNLRSSALKVHKSSAGKIQVIGKVSLKDPKKLSLFYTPGVAYASLAIKNRQRLSFEYTNRANTIAILTDGSRILGLGNIGPEAGMPVMEGKALLFKKYGGVDAIPLAISAKTKQDIIDFATMLAPSVGAINLEDIRSPDCVEILKMLESTLDIPVFHDDNQGTGIVAYAGLINALRLVNKKIDRITIVMNGAGAAGYGIANLLMAAGARDIIMCDTAGTIYKGREENMNSIKHELANKTNKSHTRGTLRDAANGADVIIGTSNPGMFDRKLISNMSSDPIVFALANPYPEIDYKQAKQAGAAVVATGRSDRPNQVNNLLAFPGVMRGILDVRARSINDKMLLAASHAIASVVEADLSPERIVPSFNHDSTALKVLAATAGDVAAAAIATGVARTKPGISEIKSNSIRLFKKYQRLEKLLTH